MNSTAIRAGDYFMVSNQKIRRRLEMVKVRAQGTTNDLKKFRRMLERIKVITVVSASDTFSNKGTTKYFRQYFDIRFKQENKTSKENEIKED